MILCGALGVGCASANTGGTAGTLAEQNTVSALKLTEDQSELLALMGGAVEARFFEFSTTETFESFEVWVERYDGGVLAEPHVLGLAMSGPLEPWAGKLGLTINGSSWTLVYSDGENGGISHSSPEVTDYSGEGVARIAAPLGGSVELKAGEPVLLYARLYSTADMSRGITAAAYEANAYAADPALLAAYDHAYLVKCMFS